MTECLTEQPEEGTARLVSQLQRCQFVVVCCAYLGRKLCWQEQAVDRKKRRNYEEGPGQDTGS